jgi:hypothetical protein
MMEFISNILSAAREPRIVAAYDVWFLNIILCFAIVDIILNIVKWYSARRLRSKLKKILPSHEE